MRIEYERHRSIPKNGGAGNHLNMAIKAAQILDYRLAIAQHFIDDQAIAPLLGFDHHDLFAIRARGTNVKVFAQADVWNDFTPDVGHMLPVGSSNVITSQFDALQRVG